MSLAHKFAPLAARLRGVAPLCPWSSALRNLHPGNFRAVPPASDIRIVRTENDRHLLRFGDRHEFWFPQSMQPNRELWSEYLVTTWNHRANPHYYLQAGIVLGSEDVVVDCGACEGFFARQALDLGVRRVICVEPNAEMADCLAATFAPEIQSGRLIVVAAALGSISGEANFSVAPGEAFSGQFSDSGDQRVPILTLDRLTATHGTPTMVKMDLEGSEYEALRGGYETLRNSHPKLAITTYHHPWDHAVVSAYLRGVGYRHQHTTATTLRDGKVPRPVMLHAWGTR